MLCNSILIKISGTFRVQNPLEFQTLWTLIAFRLPDKLGNLSIWIDICHGLTLSPVFAHWSWLSVFVYLFRRFILLFDADCDPTSEACGLCQTGKLK